jgi:hypothetical protein
MDTFEARTNMADLGHRGLQIVERVERRGAPTREETLELRQLLRDARALLADAGYPAEAVWRGLQRGSMGAETQFDEVDPGYWASVAEDLRAGLGTLESLITRPRGRDTDVNLIV